MKYNIRGEKVEVTEAIRSYIEDKIGKLDKYFENADNITASVVIKVRGKERAEYWQMVHWDSEWECK